MRGLSGMESAAGQDEPEAFIREAGVCRVNYPEVPDTA